MGAVGLRRVVDLCRSFNFEPLNTQLDKLQQTIEFNEKKSREHLLTSMAQIQEVCAALNYQTHPMKARDYLLSILQHLLLIQKDGPNLVQYYQFLDSLVTDVVINHRLAGAGQRLGGSVESFVSQFNGMDQYRILEAEAAKMRADLCRLQLEKEMLEGEVIEGGHGLIGNLKGKVAILEETNAQLQAHLEAQKSNYEEQITQLESQNMELFQALNEPSVDDYGRDRGQQRQHE
jgi:cytokinesis protein